ncbi:MAG TPA: hypothetical protein VFL95_08840 [Gemmatimonadales bacterium]|nr:hypothetical protein [Gemmatimonadales bacterium]
MKHGEALVATEQYQVSRDQLTGELLVPNQVKVRYTAKLRDDGSTSEVEARVFPADAPANAAPAQQSRGRFRGDSVEVETRSGGTTHDTTVATQSGAVFYMNPSFAMVEQIVRRARALGGAEASVPVFLASALGQTAAATVRFTSADSARVSLAGTEIRLAIDSTGRILWGAIPSQDVTIVRTSPDGRAGGSQR